MKFILVVMLALAVHANASSVQVVDIANRHSPVGTWGPALVNVGSPWGVLLGHAGLAVGAPIGAPLIGLNQGIHGGIPAIGGLWGHGLGHGLGLAPAGIALGHGLGLGLAPAGIALGHGHDGQYVAANRGSVHVAPLAGHIQSVKSANLEPAPGTTW